jgi:riboflavin kinase
MILRGVAASGLGKATLFTQIRWVSSQLEEKLEVRPYPGTFNMRLVAADQISQWERLKGRPGFPLDDPAENSCAAVCYPVVVNERVRGAILIPGVPGYPPDQVEIVASESVRRALNVRDGDTITLRVVERDARGV